MTSTKPSFNAARILAGSWKLPKALFVLWHATWPWDNGEKGCTLSAERMGMLVGAKAETVENNRRLLVRLGLMERVGQARGAGWKCRFPAEVAVSTAKALSPEETRDGVQLFDSWLLARATVPTADIPGQVPGNATTTTGTDSREKSRDTRTLRAGGPSVRSSFSSLSSLLPEDQTLLALLQLQQGGKRTKEGRGDGIEQGDERAIARATLGLAMQRAISAGDRPAFDRLRAELDTLDPPTRDGAQVA